jgi:hypothetical protein
MNAPAAEPDPLDHRVWPPYPGYDAAFGSAWPVAPVVTHEIDRAELLAAARRGDPHERAYAVVNLFLAGFDRLRKRDENTSVAVCVVPDDVYQYCRPESRVEEPSTPRLTREARSDRRRGMGSLFEEIDLSQYRMSPDFRRQLKARSMRHGVPVQILRESTLRLVSADAEEDRDLTPLSDRLWNTATTVYYKCGGKPWKLAGARPGVCYIGLAFRRTEDRGNTACCAAQMFLDSGDGVVFLGEYGPWYSHRSRQFHLTADAARHLLAGVLETYRQQDGRPLSEVFLHSRSTIGGEEFEGFRSACPAGVKLVGVRVRTDARGPRLYRVGSMPVLRGTFWRLGDRSGYLFGSGFKPRLATYDGPETPVPMRIDVQHGDADVGRVAGDILALTKLNYNACRLGDADPVTVGFSDAVGEILISNPTVTERRPNFKFYI